MVEHKIIPIIPNTFFLCLVTYKGELYIFGGYNAHLDQHFSDLWKFNPGALVLYVKMEKTNLSCCCKALLYCSGVE